VCVGSVLLHTTDQCEHGTPFFSVFVSDPKKSKNRNLGNKFPDFYF